MEPCPIWHISCRNGHYGISLWHVSLNLFYIILQTMHSCLDTCLKGKRFIHKTLCCIIYELLSFILFSKLNQTSCSYSASDIYVYSEVHL